MVQATAVVTLSAIGWALVPGVRIATFGTSWVGHEGIAGHLPFLDAIFSYFCGISVVLKCGGVCR